MPVFRRLGLLLGAASALGFVMACAPSPDPARITNPDPAFDSGAGVSSSSSSGTPTPTDNGDPSDPLAANVVFAVDVGFGGTNEAHAAVGDAGAAPTAQANPDCLSCHGADTTGAQTKYLIGGLVFETTTADGGTPCSDCEVLFVDTNSRRVKVKTGADGTFALSADEFGAVGANLRVGIRKGSLGAPMPGDETINGAGGSIRGCNNSSCHRVGAEGPISLGVQ